MLEISAYILGNYELNSKEICQWSAYFLFNSNNIKCNFGTIYIQKEDIKSLGKYLTQLNQECFFMPFDEFFYEGRIRGEFDELIANRYYVKPYQKGNCRFIGIFSKRSDMEFYVYYMTCFHFDIPFEDAKFFGQALNLLYEQMQKVEEIWKHE